MHMICMIYSQYFSPSSFNCSHLNHAFLNHDDPVGIPDLNINVINTIYHLFILNL